MILKLSALLVPAVTGTALYWLLKKDKKGMTLPKTVGCFSILLVTVNLFIRLGLYFIGMKSMDFFSMRNSFARNWLLLGMVISVVLVLLIWNIGRVGIRIILKDGILSILPAALFSGITYFIYTPSTLFLKNIDELNVTYKAVFGILALVFMLWLSVIMVLVICTAKTGAFKYLLFVVFSGAFGAYIQANFLNPDFPGMNGQKPDWAVYRTDTLISITVWMAVLSGICFLLLRYKKRAAKALGYVSVLLSLMQIISLIVLVLSSDKEIKNHVFLKDDEFNLGSDQNVLIFVEDTLDADAFSQYINSEFFNKESFADFTYYDNTVSGGATTAVAMPVLLSGTEYDPMQKYEDYIKEVWEENKLFSELEKNGFNSRIYSSPDSMAGMPEGFVPNFVERIENDIDKKEFMIRLMEISCFQLAPMNMKRLFWISTDDIKKTINTSDDIFSVSDADFYGSLIRNNGLNTKYVKTFRLYHLEGIHPPFEFDDNLNYVEHDSVTELQVIRGIAGGITNYIQYMKDKGIYDNSMIVVVGDHGRHIHGNTKANPALLIKMPFETHDFQTNSTPVAFRNLYATLIHSVSNGQNGMGASLSDISTDSDVERLHTMDRDAMYGMDKLAFYADKEFGRFIIYDTEGSTESFSEWIPTDINRIDYSPGDIIDFTKESKYIKDLANRLYYNDKGAYASNELTICFDINDFKKKDMVLDIELSELMSESQTMKLYANGSRLEIYDITAQNKSLSLDIPEAVFDNDMLDEGLLVVRMVFPGAVTPHMLDEKSEDYRVLSVNIESISLDYKQD